MLSSHCLPPLLIVTAYVQPQPGLQTNGVAQGKLPWEVHPMEKQQARVQKPTYFFYKI